MVPRMMGTLLQRDAFSALVLYLICVVFANVSVAPQTTHPSDVAALNTVFATWGISAEGMGWNMSGELCSGTAIDSTEIVDSRFDRLIKCDCSFDNGSTCRITRLKLRQLDAHSPIPDALWSLTYLIDLNVARNYLTGDLSPSVGNLTRLQYLGVDVNMLSGQLPKELGLLTDLKLLFVGNNNFTGSLPPEMGNLAKLDILNFASSGVIGEIPLTFTMHQTLA